MRFRTLATSLAVVAAFAAGIVVSPAAHHFIGTAHAQAQPAPLVAQMIDLTAIKYDDLPSGPNPDLHTKTFAVSPGAGTVGIQIGNVNKHIHQQTDEVQFIVEGSGAMWLGDERREFKPGTLIIIPRNTPHAGAIVTNGPVKAIAIKLPPQGPTDTTFVN